MAVISPVSERATVVALLMLTFATGLVDAISVLVLGHVFVANMTGNVVFLGFWLAPQTTVDMAGVLVAFASFVVGAVIGGRYARHLGAKVRIWLATALGTEVALLTTMATVVEWALIARSPRARCPVEIGPAVQMAVVTALPAAIGDRLIGRLTGI